MKLSKSFSVYSALLALSGAARSEETTTITHTNYVTPDCMKQQIDSAMVGNPQSLSTGIPVFFVYGDEQAKQQSVETRTSTMDYTVSTNTVSEETITRCSGNQCTPTTVQVTHPYEYTTTVSITYTTALTPSVGTAGTASTTSTATPLTRVASASASASSTSSNDNARTVYDYDTETDNTVLKKYRTRTAKTTTETIFQATTTPSTIFKGSTSVETITSTMEDPLITKTVVKKINTVKIDVNRYTTSVTINDSEPSSEFGRGVNSTTTAGPSSSSLVRGSSNSTSAIGSANSTALRGNSTSTIDLRVSQSSLYSSAATRGAKFSNGTQSRQRHSSSEFGISDLVASAHPSSLSSGFSSVPTYEAELSSAVPSSSSSSPTSSSSSSPSSSSSASPSSADTSYSSQATRGARVTSTPNDNSGNLFEAISTGRPASIFSRDELPLSIPDGVDNNDDPIGTNKFYANLFLGSQTDTIWSNPYGMVWKKQDYYGFGVQHTNVSDRVFGNGNTNNGDVPSYFANPTGNSELIFSADVLTSDANEMRVTDMRSMSVKVSLAESLDETTSYIEMPIVQGMGFVTGIYHGTLIPILNSLIGVDNLSRETSDQLSSTTMKYRATLFNGVRWLIYITLPDSTDFELSSQDPYHIQGSTSVDGMVIQIAVAPEDPSLEVVYDSSAGTYVTDATVEGEVTGGDEAEYRFVYSTAGDSASGQPIVFVFPHHDESLTSSTQNANTGISLNSTTKGLMKGYMTDTIAMSETLETSIQFLPWVQNMDGRLSYSSEQLQLLASVANDELDVDINATVMSMESNYASGKVIDKYAYILLVASEILQDDDVTESTLEDMKRAFEPFINNRQTYPLFYDTKFKGVTSSASQNGDTGADFGSGYYNDHHFHYGYFVHAAAVVGYIDSKRGGSWASENQDWVNALIRDVANPSEDDTYFPVSRMFDWFAGHSWAAGLFTSGDGKNEESSSEDYNFAYGMKLWGNVIGDNSMESRGDLMLAVMSRALNKYFYYKSDNTVEPSEYIPNKVSGIFFENKITYSTYFGSPQDHPEYVHGIHMLPITPASSLIRIPSYVQEEWDDQISTFISDVDSGWTGILRLNQALYDASTSYDFFSASDWNSNHLDNGQSRTWSLAFSGGISNAT